MPDLSITLPSKPRAISEEGFAASFEVEGLSPGYGHTLGNSLRRIILSSLPGTAITSVKIDGISHEFSTMEGVKEDVITILLNLKKIHFNLLTNEPQEVTLLVRGQKKVTAEDIKLSGQVQIVNPEQYICEITGKGTTLGITIKLEKGLGYVSKEAHKKDKVEIGTIALDAVFTPIRRVNYEVENMRVGDRTDYNKLKIFIETNGTITPREALEQSIKIMIQQLQAIVGFQEEVELKEKKEAKTPEVEEEVGDDKDFLKTRVDSLGFSTRTANALERANIRTIGGLARKSEHDLRNLDGLGEKGIQEIKRTLSNFGITLK